MDRFSVATLQRQRVRYNFRTNNPRFLYFGGGAKNKLSEAWVELNRAVTRYVDITSGCNNQAFAIGKTSRVPVTVNDISYFSHCMGVALFHRDRETDINKIARVLVEAQKTHHTGIFCRNRSDNPSFNNEDKSTLPHEFTSYIDGLVLLIEQKLSYPDAMFMKACIGRTFLAVMSMKNLIWYSRKGEGILLTHSYQIPSSTYFAKEVFKAAKIKNRFFTPGAAYCMPAVDFLNLEGLNLEDTTVCIDPPWPHGIRELRQVNYSPFYKEIGDILFQRETTGWSPWPMKDLKRVTNEVAYMAHLALNKGAREVYIWSQNTNLPSKEEIADQMSQHFNCEEVLSVVQPSKGFKLTFRDFVFRLTRIK